MAETIALIGGTGPEGRGLATRFAMAGHPVLVGSRDVERAVAAANEVAETLKAAGHTSSLRGVLNREAASLAEIVVIVVPFEAHRAMLELLADDLAGKTVVDAVVPMRFERGPRPVEVEEGSAAEQAAKLLPRSHVLAAFHTIAATTLLGPSTVIMEDVLVTGDNAKAKQAVCALAEEIEGVRAIDAGPLRFSRFVEGITVLLIGINGRYKTQSGVHIEGLPA